MNMEEQMPTGTWGFAEAAKYIGCKEGTLKVWASKRRVPFIKVGRLTRFLKSDLDDYLAERRVPVQKIR